MLRRWALRELRVARAAFEPGAVRGPGEELAERVWVGENVLTGPFSGTRGFSVIFRRAGLATLAERLPAVMPFVDRLLSRDTVRDMVWRPLLWLGDSLVPEPNAFYLNLLIIPAGERVTPHVEGTLTTACGLERAPPILSSVLYLHANTGAGGELVVYGRNGVPATIDPRPGDLVTFRGDLLHEVLPVEAGAPARVSLVCEQYRVAPEELAAVPELKVQSKDLFKRVLAAGGGDRPDAGTTLPDLDGQI